MGWTIEKGRGFSGVDERSACSQKNEKMHDEDDTGVIKTLQRVDRRFHVRLLPKR